MDENTHDRVFSIFFPEYQRRVEEIKLNSKSRFVHYTSAEAAMKIIQDRKIWMRNAQCMNDQMEIAHGVDCLNAALWNDQQESRFKDFLESIYPGTFEKLVAAINQWLPSFRLETYIASVSEHDSPSEDDLGRLSMWRAYGGKSPVALVLNPGIFIRETDAFNAYTTPVWYCTSTTYKNHFDDLLDRMIENLQFIKNLGADVLSNYIFDYLKVAIFTTKHEGFREEREWRITYNTGNPSLHVDTSIEVVNGVPQAVCKIELADIPEKGFIGASVPELIDRIIIGPSDNQNVIRSAFIRILTAAGCNDASARVICSGIPLK